ncbi:MAG: hypothetical protein JW808_10360 [Victivallales bacterium]|nr:hypothetical protein [Victivallales bacterium]
MKKMIYLGPAGTYTHQVAELRFTEGYEMEPASTIFEACERVKESCDNLAVLPLENSSAGTITFTIDTLLHDPELTVIETMSLVVKLALLGRKGVPIKRLYSHFAPFRHCSAWIRSNLPGIECHEVSSTAEAAIAARDDVGSAALGPRRLSELYQVDVLEYPVEQEIANETEFGVLSRVGKEHMQSKGARSNLAVELKNGPGSLCSFLMPFRDADINLTRIISRPVYGAPSKYAFYIDIMGNRNDAKVKVALSHAMEHCDSLRVIGSYDYSGKYYS